MLPNRLWPSKYENKTLTKTIQMITNYVYFLIERYTEIERENRILLEKMTNILQK